LALGQAKVQKNRSKPLSVLPLRHDTEKVLICFAAAVVQFKGMESEQQAN
jgi:hypothetical protein